MSDLEAYVTPWRGQNNHRREDRHKASTGERKGGGRSFPVASLRLLQNSGVSTQTANILNSVFFLKCAFAYGSRIYENEGKHGTVWQLICVKIRIFEYPKF